MTAVALPGYTVASSPPPPRDEGLRNDVAAFLGSAERGPLNLPVRVAGRQAYRAVFGGPGTGSVPRAAAAYFSNGGEVAWIVRAGSGGTAAAKTHAIGSIGSDGFWTPDGPARMSCPGDQLTVTASSVGVWANGGAVRIGYRAFGTTGPAELDLIVEVPGFDTVRRTGLSPAELIEALNATGAVVAAFSGRAVQGRADGEPRGPAQLSWQFVLEGGADP